ncbi:MAG: M6 family metalloprotease domain-containing protein [Bacteroidales bacterium]|nr:M6 family metalloprotease domain-containing protein [Candidatus Cryptobacteroides caccocaballi]
MPKRYLTFILVLLMTMAMGHAKPALPGLRILYQPDGTSFMAELRGDEFGHILISSQGHALVQGNDGFYDYAHFDENGARMDSGVHFASPGAPSEVVRASLAIPYDKLAASAFRRRNSVSIANNGSMRRISAVSAKASESMTRHGLVILVNYQDVEFRNTRDDFQDLLTKPGYSFNGARGSAKEYFDAQFHGIYDFEFDVIGPVTVSKDRAYYGANDAAGNDKAPHEMIVEACRKADAEVDFSLYDDDGDGEVDNVFVFYAGGDEAEHAGEDCIWAHAWYVKDGAGVSLTLDGKVINRYACGSELLTKDSGKTFAITTIGTFCHEFSHTLGLSDLYDTDYEKSGGLSSALWRTTSLMDQGNFNDWGNCPPFYNAIEREMLGIGECRTLSSGRIDLPAIHRSNTYYRINGDVDGEYYLIESRMNEEWDSFIGGKGLLVYHVDRSSNNAGRSDGYGFDMTASDRWWYNQVNANPSHMCADLVEADPGATSPDRNPVGRVFFPYGSYDSMEKDGRTPIAFWSGQVADLNITRISYSSGVSSFYVSGSGDVEEPAKVSEIVSQDIFQDAAVIRFTSDKPAGAANVQWNQSGREPAAIRLEPYGEGAYSLILEELSPSTSYTAVIWFENQMGAGESCTVKFMTASRSDKSYPFIYLKNVERNDDGSFIKGCEIPLRVYNPGKDADGVLWYYNDYPIKIGKDGYWRPESSGVLRAEIVSRSGKRNKVSKQINIRK